MTELFYTLIHTKALSNPDFGEFTPEQQARILGGIKDEYKQLLHDHPGVKYLVQEADMAIAFVDALYDSTTTILVGELAKFLREMGFDFSQSDLFEWLRLNGYLIGEMGPDYNMPTPKSDGLGLFTVKSVVNTYHDTGGVTVTRTPMISGKGWVYFTNRFLEFRKSVVNFYG